MSRRFRGGMNCRRLSGKIKRPSGEDARTTQRDWVLDIGYWSLESGKENGFSLADNGQ